MELIERLEEMHQPKFGHKGDPCTACGEPIPCGGAKEDYQLPPGADLPMRQAIETAFMLLAGEWPEFIFSGWGGELTESELAVVEDREPSVGGLENNSCERCDKRIMHTNRECTVPCVAGEHEITATYQNYGYWRGQCGKCQKVWEVDSSG